MPLPTLLASASLVFTLSYTLFSTFRRLCWSVRVRRTVVGPYRVRSKVRVSILFILYGKTIAV